MQDADVWHDSNDPLDAVMAHTFAVAFGLGDATGTIRFRVRRVEPTAEIVWDQPWFTNLGSGSDDNGSGGGAGDGWDAGECGSWSVPPSLVDPISAARRTAN